MPAPFSTLGATFGEVGTKRRYDFGLLTGGTIPLAR